MDLIRPQSRNLSEKAYDAIKEAIFNQELPLGSPLPEGPLCDRLGISRTPVRAAMERLEQEGWVTRIPKMGVIVSPLNVGEVHDVFDVRQILEPKSLETAFSRADRKDLLEFRDAFQDLLIDWEEHASAIMALDEKFHMYIAERSGNQWVVRIMKLLLQRSVMMRVMSANAAGRGQQVTLEFTALIDRWLQGNVTEASRLLLEHILNAKADVLGHDRTAVGNDAEM